MSGELGRLVLQFAADVAGFQSDLGRVERAAAKSAKETAASFDKAIGGLTGSIKSAAINMGAALAAAFTVNALKDFVKAGIDVADQINEISKKTGVSTEALSGLKFAAEQSGVSFETLGSALIKLEINASKAATGNENLEGIFKALGVSVKDTSGQIKTGNVLFTELSGALSKIGDAGERNKTGVELFGKSFAKLIPLLNEGPEGLANFTREAERLGLIVSSETGKAADDFGDSLAAIKSASEGAGLALATELLPVLIEAANRTTDFIVAARESGAITAFAGALDVMAKSALGVALIVTKTTEAIVALDNAIANRKSVTGNGVGSIGGSEQLGGQRNGLQGSASGSVAPPKAEISATETALRNYRAELAKIQAAQKNAGASATEFVKAVRVLTLEKSIVGTPKELAEAVRNIREELDPTLRITREYDEAVKTLTKSTAADSNQRERNERTLKALTIQRDKDIAAAQRSVSTTGGIIESLQREAEALKGSAFDREQLAKAIRIETAYREALAQAIAENGKVTDEEKKKIRELVEEIDKLSNKKTFNFAGALSDAINEGFAKGSLTAGFKNLIKQLKEAFSNGPEGVAGAVASIANGLSTIITAAQNSDGNSTGDAVRAGVGLLADAGNVFAQAALAIDTLFKGNLFGTSFARQSQTNSSSFGASGFAGNVQTVDTRRRSLFRGTQTRTTNTGVDAATQEAGAAFQSALDDISRTIADAFNTTLSARVAASFVQKFDKDGKLISTIATVGGRAVAAGTQQAFEQFLTAQTIIDALGPSIAGLDALADPFRASGTAILEFAQFAFAAQTDLAQGAELLGPGSAFAQILPVIEDLSRGGESLSETYKRVRDGANLFDEALAAIGATSQLARTEFVKFTAELVNQLGGLANATGIIGRNIAEFFSPTELRATRLTGARATLSGLGESSGLGLLSSEAFKDVLSQALAGAFDTERTAEILAYGDALALVNSLVRETTAANQEAIQAEADRARAIQDATKTLNEFVTALQDQSADGSLTEYQRTIRALNKQYEENGKNLLELARAAGLTAAPIEGVTANLSILAQGAARALSDLKVSVLQGLDSLFGSQASTFNNFGALNDFLAGNAVATQNWAQQLKDLEKLQSTQDLARNIADLFDASGLSFAAGVEQYGLPLRALLGNLGVDFANLTSTASIDAFGAAANLLGVSADELASIAGIDLSGLTDAQITALDVASAPQVEAAEASANSLASIDDKSTSVITLLMQQNTTAREQADILARLGASVNSLSDEMRRLANRVPSA